MSGKPTTGGVVAVAVRVGRGVTVGAGTGVFVAGGTGVFVAGGTGVFVAGGTGVFVAAGTGVFVGVLVNVLVEVEVAVEVAVGARQIKPVMALESNVTEPVCAKARPSKLAPVCRLMDVEARIFPINEVFVPRVADETTLHHTLHGSPPTTLAVPEVMRVLADLKIQTPDPLRVSVPDNSKASAQ